MAISPIQVFQEADHIGSLPCLEGRGLGVQLGLLVNDALLVGLQLGGVAHLLPFRTLSCYVLGQALGICHQA